MFDVLSFRESFPILKEEIHGQPLVYFDNAATSQMPQCVIDEISNHYAHDNANVHRGIHTLSNRSTRKLENARKSVARFLNAHHEDCVIFTSGTTASINLAASSLCRSGLLDGSAIVTTLMEHHSNLVPWQQAAKAARASLQITGLDENADLEYNQLERMLRGENVSLVTLAHVSNVTGAVNDIARVSEMAHRYGALVLVDAAQSVAHVPIDMQALGCDLLAFSGHKMYAATGIGALCMTPELRDRLEPVVFGGEMVSVVTALDAVFEDAPLKFEAGTPNYVGALSLGAAIGFLQGVDRRGALAYEELITEQAIGGLQALPGVKVLGNPKKRASVVSFLVDGVHPYDIATMLDLHGIASRSGSCCAQPLLADAFETRVVTRFSFAPYNTSEEVNGAIETLSLILERLRGGCRG